MIYKILDLPWFYSFVQKIFRLGGNRLRREMFHAILDDLPTVEQVLDVGCGPDSHLFKYGINPMGTDLSEEYVKEYNKKSPGVVASVEALPFQSTCVGGVWSCGLFHHVPKELAGKGIQEMVRIVKPGGYVIIMDAVLPIHSWQRPLAFLIRRLDRGQFMRTQQEIESILPNKDLWKIKRYTYNSLTKLEMLVCVQHFPNILS